MPGVAGSLTTTFAQGSGGCEDRGLGSSSRSRWLGKSAPGQRDPGEQEEVSALGIARIHLKTKVSRAVFRAEFESSVPAVPQRSISWLNISRESPRQTPNLNRFLSPAFQKSPLPPGIGNQAARLPTRRYRCLEGFSRFPKERIIFGAFPLSIKKDQELL